MVRKIVLSLIAVLVLGAYAFAQNKQVSGTVSDANGNPVAGATVMVDGTTVERRRVLTVLTRFLFLGRVFCW